MFDGPPVKFPWQCSTPPSNIANCASRLIALYISPTYVLRCINALRCITRTMQIREYPRQAYTLPTSVSQRPVGAPRLWVRRLVYAVPNPNALIAWGRSSRYPRSAQLACSPSLPISITTLSTRPCSVQPWKHNPSSPPRGDATNRCQDIYLPTNVLVIIRNAGVPVVPPAVSSHLSSRATRETTRNYISGVKCGAGQNTSNLSTTSDTHRSLFCRRD